MLREGCWHRIWPQPPPSSFPLYPSQSFHNFTPKVVILQIGSSNFERTVRIQKTTSMLSRQCQPNRERGAFTTATPWVSAQISCESTRLHWRIPAFWGLGIGSYADLDLKFNNRRSSSQSARSSTDALTHLPTPASTGTSVIPPQTSPSDSLSTPSPPTSVSSSFIPSSPVPNGQSLMNIYVMFTTSYPVVIFQSSTTFTSYVTSIVTTSAAMDFLPERKVEGELTRIDRAFKVIPTPAGMLVWISATLERRVAGLRRPPTNSMR